jgi:hypothetical protein
VTAPGLAALDVTEGAPRTATLRVTLRVQEAEVALLDASGEPLVRGSVDLDYFSPPSAGQSLALAAGAEGRSGLGFDADRLDALRRRVAALTRAAAQVFASPAELVIEFQDPAQDGSRGRATVEPFRAGLRCYQRVDTWALSYGGALSPLTGAVLDAVRGWLVAGPR